jgi:hypothetical protein
MIALLIATASAWTPSDAEQTLIRALSSRDGAPPCEQLEALVPDPVASFERVVEHVSMPPWAPMHAAACIIENHAHEHADLLASWTTGERTKGLAKLVFHRLHLLDDDQALELVETARTGPWTRELDRSLATSPKGALRDLAQPVPTTNPAK